MSVAACPRCEGQVTLPPGGRPAAQVKCPLCEEEFALSAVYDKLPPMLILLEAPVGAHTMPGGMTHGEGAFDNLFMPSADANGEGDLHLAPAGGEEGGSSFDFGGSGSGGGTAVATAPTTKTMPARAKRPPKSPAKEGIKIVLGGIVGLTAGFFILLWGFDRDLCKDVAKKPVAKVFPEWMHWSLPAGHKPAPPIVPAPNEDDPVADNQDDVNASDTDPADTTPNDTTPADTPSDAPTDPTPKIENDDVPGDRDPVDDVPGDDPGFDITPPKPSIEVDEPPLDLPPPSTTPSVDEPKFTDLLPGDEPTQPTDDVPTDDKPADDKPADDKPADVPTEENPFDVPPGSTDPDDKPADEPADEPAKVEPKEPSPGLKTESPPDEATIDSARSAASDAVETLMPSDTAAKSAFTREKFDSYAKLCEFAERLSQSVATENDPNVAAASAIVQMIADDDADTRTFGQLANAWLSKKRDNNGIALVGKVTAVETAGGLTTITVELPALEGRLEARTATVVTRENAEIKTDDEVAAVGAVIEKPADAIVGYSGTDAQVIWGAWVGKRGG